MRRQQKLRRAVRHACSPWRRRYLADPPGSGTLGCLMTVAELPLADTLARPLRDLRISVTDRCNFRCAYCMPREVFGRDFAFLPRDELLTFEEITRLARVFVGEGVERFASPAASRCCATTSSGWSRCWPASTASTDIALTTNGSLLAAKAHGAQGRRA